MAKLKLGPIADDKPVRLSVDLPAQIHRDLQAYAEALAREGAAPIEPARLVAPMLARFMATDRAFAAARRSIEHRNTAAITASPFTTDRGGPPGERG